MSECKIVLFVLEDEPTLLDGFTLHQAGDKQGASEEVFFERQEMAAFEEKTTLFPDKCCKRGETARKTGGKRPNRGGKKRDRSGRDRQSVTRPASRSGLLFFP